MAMLGSKGIGWRPPAAGRLPGSQPNLIYTKAGTQRPAQMPGQAGGFSVTHSPVTKALMAAQGGAVTPPSIPGAVDRRPPPPPPGGAVPWRPSIPTTSDGAWRAGQVAQPGRQGVSIGWNGRPETLSPEAQRIAQILAARRAG